MQRSHTGKSFSEPPNSKPSARLINELDIVMALGPIITNEQHPGPLSASTIRQQRGGDSSDLMARCSPTKLGHDIPSAVRSPHDRRAHGLPQDLKGQKRRVLTRQPLPMPSLPQKQTRRNP
jgi:hypothetical protein